MCFGPFKRLCHWGPITALGIIKCVTGMTIHCNSMWWPPHESFSGLLNSVCFLTFSGLTVYNFLSAVACGPGFLPLNWKPEREEDCEFLQWCHVCNGYKAPRAHHCQKCGRCVKKMDHHCPWINHCVGWGNHCYFTAFLGFAVIGCFHASIVLGFSLYRGINRVWYMYYGTGREPVVYLNVYTLILSVFALGLAIGVVLAVGMLFYFQVRAILRNRTGIEDWILEKANHRRQPPEAEFVYPYDLGCRRNITQVITLSGSPVGNGIDWPIVEGCDQYTLTREQKIQKAEKRDRARTYSIVRDATGSWVPLWSQGLRVCLHPPCTDERRIALSRGDMVTVTRWRKHWLFGEKIFQACDEKEQPPRVRGWFPRQCAVELLEGHLEESQQHFHSKKML